MRFFLNVCVCMATLALMVAYCMAARTTGQPIYAIGLSALHIAWIGFLVSIVVGFAHA